MDDKDMSHLLVACQRYYQAVADGVLEIPSPEVMTMDELRAGIALLEAHVAEAQQAFHVPPIEENTR